jgi:hypothetical protein
MTNSAEEIYNNFDNFITNLIGRNLDIDLVIDVNVFENPAEFYIQFNNVDVYNAEFVNGTHQIRLNLEQSTCSQILRFGMRNKKENETVLENGKIVKDKFILLKEFRCNNYLLTDDYEFMYNKIRYINTCSNEMEDVKFGFWKNCCIEMQFSNPFDLYYNNNSSLNQNFSDPLVFRNNNYDITNSLIESLKKLK